MCITFEITIAFTVGNPFIQYLHTDFAIIFYFNQLFLFLTWEILVDCYVLSIIHSYMLTLLSKHIGKEKGNYL